MTNPFSKISFPRLRPMKLGLPPLAAAGVLAAGLLGGVLIAHAAPPLHVSAGRLPLPGLLRSGQSDDRGVGRPGPHGAEGGAGPERAWPRGAHGGAESEQPGPGGDREGRRERRAAGPASALRTAAGLAESLATARADRASAEGKTDLTRVDALLASAETLIGEASPNLASSDTTVAARAREQASAANDALRAAHSAMAAGVGAPLPSADDRPAPQAADTISPQVRASRDAAHAYQDVAEATAAARVANLAPANDLIGAAQGLYQQAFEAYQAGNYDQAIGFSRAAGHAARATNHLLHSQTTPAVFPATLGLAAGQALDSAQHSASNAADRVTRIWQGDTPETVPAPGF